VDSGGREEAQVQSYSPGGANVLTWEGTLAPPGEYNCQTSCKVWLAPSERRRSSDEGKTQKLLKFAGVPQTNETISAASEPKFTILRGRMEEILLLNKFFFSDCRYMP